MTNNKATEYDLVIYGLRKFTGGMGDEDEIERNSSTWKRYFLKDLSQTSNVLCLQVILDQTTYKFRPILAHNTILINIFSST